MSNKTPRTRTRDQAKVRVDGKTAGMAALVATDDWGRVMAAREEAERFERFTRGTTLRELQTLPEDELVLRYDHLLASERLGLRLGPQDYLDELQRRAIERQSKRLEWLTWALVALTIVITVATVALLIRGE